MEMRWIVFIVIHIDHNSQKAAYFRHIFDIFEKMDEILRFVWHGFFNGHVIAKSSRRRRDENLQGLQTGARGWSKYAQFLLDFSKLIASSKLTCSIAAKQPSPCSRFLEQWYTPIRDLLEWHLQYALGNATLGAYANQRHAPWLGLVPSILPGSCCIILASLLRSLKRCFWSYALRLFAQRNFILSGVERKAKKLSGLSQRGGQIESFFGWKR